jgi:hypothetical protein
MANLTGETNENSLDRGSWVVLLLAVGMIIVALLSTNDSWRQPSDGWLFVEEEEGQTAVDRRFFRQKYDAAQILADFAQTARDEVDMEALQAELLRVVQETLQPEMVSVWIKPEAGNKS